MRHRLSACILQAEHFYRAALERLIGHHLPAEKIWMYVDGPNCHDEFSIRSTFSGKGVSILPAAPPEPHPAVVPEDPAWAGYRVSVGNDEVLDSCRGEKKQKSTTVSKVLQTQSNFASLMKLGEQKVLVKGSAGTHLQILESTSGECIFKALVGNCKMISTCVERASLRVRLATSDSHKGTKRAELAIVNSREVWCGLHLFCEAHVAASCLEHALVLMKDVTSKLLHACLALRGSTGSMCTFRKALAAVTLQRLKIRIGQPSAHANHFRVACIAAFTHGRPHKQKRQAILHCLSNGDWTKRDVVEHFVVASEDPPPKMLIAKKMANDLVWALAPAAPTVFKPRLGVMLTFQCLIWAC